MRNGGASSPRAESLAAPDTVGSGKGREGVEDFAAGRGEMGAGSAGAGTDFPFAEVAEAPFAGAEVPFADGA